MLVLPYQHFIYVMVSKLIIQYSKNPRPFLVLPYQHAATVTTSSSPADGLLFSSCSRRSRQGYRFTSAFGSNLLSFGFICSRYISSPVGNSSFGLIFHIFFQVTIYISQGSCIKLVRNEMKII